MTDIATFLALALLVAQATPAEPRTRPLTPEDALYTLPFLTGPCSVVDDLDGDGAVDLVVQRRGRLGPLEAIALDGTPIRRLWGPATSERAEIKRGVEENEGLDGVPWDVGGDVDGDGVPDVLVGLPWDDRGGSAAGRVLLVSGADGEVVQEWIGDEAHEGLGHSVAFIGDVNGDGVEDCAVGAVQVATWDIPPFPRTNSNRVRTLPDGTMLHSFVIDGKDVYPRELWGQRIGHRSERAGFVAAFSGADGARLWRVEGRRPGEAFGVHVAAIGDLDGDGKQDVLAHAEPGLSDPIRVLSGATGESIAELPNTRGRAGRADDFDGDGVEDVFIDSKDLWVREWIGSVQVVSGTTWETLAALDRPDFWDRDAITRPVGDLDGDGCADLALGGPNFNIGEPGEAPEGAAEAALAELRGGSLDDALAIPSQPWNAWSWESGCVLVYSGRTRKVLMGVWGEPFSREGLGWEVAVLPDVNCDGAPDLLVAVGGRGLVFAGPGHAEQR